ncbi:MAG: antibiotic biosynthesis monooxygenase [Peptococcaceae bacterium]|nr:antibiotic biosynthesis monooxygenase [Peptococcaceae bacterium]
MIILHVTYTMKPGQAENFISAIEQAGIDAATRNENGCLQYDYFYAAQTPDRILLVERWADADSLKAHTCAPHFQELAKMKDQYVLDTAIVKYIGE